MRKYTSSKRLQQMMNCGRSTADAVRRTIRDNPERYGNYAVCDTRIMMAAFVDAFKFRKAIDAGLVDELPPFDAQAIESELSGVA